MRSRTAPSSVSYAAAMAAPCRACGLVLTCFVDGQKFFKPIRLDDAFLQPGSAVEPHRRQSAAQAGAAAGDYRFIVRQLASSNQLFGNGYATADRSYLNSGTLTIESAAGQLNRSNSLASLRGGQGVRAGTIKITDRSGASTNLD